MVVLSIISMIHNGSVLHVDINGVDQLQQLNAQMDATRLDALSGMLLAVLSLPFLVLMFVTPYIYALDALRAERADRSILFWKSLPLSDTETVLSKFATALLVMPLITAAAVTLTQLVLLVLTSIQLHAVPGLLGHLWSPSVWLGWWALGLWVMLACALWYAPLVAFALLISASVRSPLIVAAIAPLAAMLAEYMVFRTHYVRDLLAERTAGVFGYLFGQHHPGVGFVIDERTIEVPRAGFDLIHPSPLLGAPETWIGLAVAAALLAATVWMRRYRDSTI
jgi:ABC-2 type transport system permease protein